MSEIDSIRADSRALVRELGFMQPTLAATDYSASAVHALLEIDANEGMTSVQLVQLLGLEKSSVSRMLAKLVAAGDVKEVAAIDDGRFKPLQLTPQGRARSGRFIPMARCRCKVRFSTSIAPSNKRLRRACLHMQEHLKPRLNMAKKQQSPITVSAGYRPGLVGRIVEMHAAFYSTHSNFGQYFESQVASGAAEFTRRLNEPCNRVWTALLNDRIVGSLAIDGQDLGENRAHLRWFILDDGCRGSGVGRQLMTEAMTFCDVRGFREVHLWTIKGLDAARKLYESFGFKLQKEEQGTQWGSTVTEQQFVRVSALAPSKAPTG